MEIDWKVHNGPLCCDRNSPYFDQCGGFMRVFVLIN